MADTATAAAPPEAPGAPPAKLDDLMLAMDVVDTLRHEETLVEKELNQDMRDEALKKRLRQIYESQGLTVTDRILDEGIKALRESRFTYTPRGTGFARTLANLWVRRRAVGTALAAIIVVLAVVVGWNAIRSGSEQRAAEEARIELTETLPRQLETVGETTLAAATDPAARAQVGLERLADGPDLAQPGQALAALGEHAQDRLERARVDQQVVGILAQQPGDLLVGARADRQRRHRAGAEALGRRAPAVVVDAVGRRAAG